MKRTWLTGILLTCAMAGAALATVPSTMTYQGVLASSSGAVVPDGAYWVRFGLYTTEATGDTSAAIWRELVQVQTVKGIFTALLGNSTSLVSVPFDVPYWLGLSVAGGAELRPRIALTASPYSLNSRGGGAITGVTAGAGLSGGGTSSTVQLDVGAGTGISVAADAVSLNTTYTDGRYINESQANSVTGAMVTDGSLTAADLADEPGVAFRNVTGGTMATPATVISSVSITLPAAGFVLVSYSGWCKINHTTGNGDLLARFSVSETTSMTFFDGGSTFWRIPSGSASGWHLTPISRSVVYQKGAGAYTFNLVADVAFLPAGETVGFNYPTLTALYLPSAYGTTISAAPAAAPARPEGPQDGTDAQIGPTGVR